MTGRPEFLPVGSGYVALGDSFAAGPGIPVTVDVECARSDGNYPHLVAGELGLALIDVTCRGASIDDLIDIPESAGVHGAPLPRQVDALLPDTSLVTVTAGGNDVGFFAALRSWSAVHAAERGQLPHGRGGLASPTPQPVDRARVEDSLRGIGPRLGDVLSAVRVHAPDARVVLVDYLTVLPPMGTEVPEVPVTSAEQEFLWHVAHALGDATATAARDHGAMLGRGSAASREHHAGSPEPWVEGFFPGLNVPPYHPDAAGHMAVARLVLDALAARG
ncbi:SGNH/GDSL hydrolase family protein [Cellulomonas timonensis]|uniref:SGNH/GDSL hydrolase family protein n=1 Tax=Cellulomonas timonensis TaxID=1689271 RepID=UPI000830D8B5|nr:SGNH/GDSL hydrolase family protein [Cellulomonas timonensis]